MNNPPRILIADDNATNRDILATRLRVHGYDLIEAADGEEALAAARTHLPDLILLDVMMPKLDGFEVCRRLKNDPTLPFMPIILVTAKTESDDVVTGLDSGADEYVTKPVDQKALVARVKAILRLKQRHDDQQNRTLPKTAVGTDLFVSYSRHDQARIEVLATVLQLRGWSVWWDRHIATGSSFDKVIEDAITKARAVIVAWSRHSVNSDWVRAEATYALEKNKLLPILLDDVVPPLRFIQVQSINLSDWDGTADAQPFRKLVADLTALAGE